MKNGQTSNDFLGRIKARAKLLAKSDKSRSHVEWLNSIAQEFGARTFELLKDRLEKQDREAEIHAEKLIWEKRFSDGPLCWGTLGPVGANAVTQSLGIPFLDQREVPWPHCFIDTRLFTVGEGPRRQVVGKLNSLDEATDAFFEGEELRIGSDQTVFMAIMSYSNRTACGQLLTFSVQDLEKAIGCKFNEMGIPVGDQEIGRSLWRLHHCNLRIDDFDFDGPLLVYADVRKAPSEYRVRINPDFYNFYSPLLALEKKLNFRL